MTLFNGDIFQGTFQQNLRYEGTYKYKNGDIDVMFMNSKTDNTGLNLENTTDLIFYHSLEGSRLKQVIGRANRIGRKTELNIHYLTV